MSDKPMEYCCCGKYNLFTCEPRSSFNGITHEIYGSRLDAFCGTAKEHAMRDLEDDIGALTIILRDKQSDFDKLYLALEIVVKVGAQKNGKNGTIYAHATHLIEIAQQAMDSVHK